MRIMVVDDDEHLQKALFTCLKKQYTVDVFSTYTEAATHITAYPYNLFIFDLMLPDGNGHQLIADVRSAQLHVPILILTSQTPTTVVSSLDKGADDYLEKPFRAEELCARIRALLRRVPALEQKVLYMGNLEYHTETHQFFIHEKQLHVQQKTHRILEYLLRNTHMFTSKQQLIDVVWDRNAELSDNAIDAQLSRLRKILLDYQTQTCLKTKRGIGYRLEKSC